MRRQELISARTVMDALGGALAETLRLEPSRVHPGSSIVADLGAESLDFLDVNYRMEQTFGIKMARHFLLEHAEELLGEGSVVDDDGRLTERGLTLLRLRYGECAVPPGESGLGIDEVSALITVQAVADSILDILDTLPERCGCGADAWRSEDGTHILCGACGEPARFADGDELTRRWIEAAAGQVDRAGDGAR